MKTVKYGDWKIAVDIEKTKEFYSNYVINDTQANRNFAEYCKNLTAEEKGFFDSFGITPECCDIHHNGVNNNAKSIHLINYIISCFSTNFSGFINPFY